MGVTGFRFIVSLFTLKGLNFFNHLKQESMKRTFNQLLRVFMLFALVSVTVISCKPKIKDTDIESKIQANTALSSIVASVKDGVVTLSGEVKDDAEKAMVETTVKAIEGVKQVVNNCTIAPPPPPPAPPVITADDPLTKGITDALKDFPKVKATAADGVITVTGETTKAEWKKIKMALDALHPKKVIANELKIK